MHEETAAVSQSSKSIKHDLLTHDDWDCLVELGDLLEPFKDATIRLQGNPIEGRHGALWEVLPTMELLLETLERKKTELQYVHSHFKTCVNLGWKKLDEYYALTDRTTAYRVATALHPSMRLLWFKVKWSHRSDWYDGAVKAVETMYAEYSSRYPELSTPPVHVASDSLTRFNHCASNKSEFDTFFDNKTLTLDCVDPLAFWSGQYLAGTMPILSRMALDLYSVTAMSAETERAFSKAGHTASSDRPRSSTYEKPPRPITEIGISTLDTRDLIGVAPGNNCEAWFALVRTRHLRIAEHAHLRNGDFVAGCPDKFEFGESEFVAQRDTPSKIAECFRPPYSRDIAPSTREVRSTKLEAGTPVKSQDRMTAPSEQPERRRVILLGHDVGQDISYLRSMGYNPLNLDNLLELLDTASMFRAMTREPSPRSLTHILYTFEIAGWNLHNAGNDAAYTMHAFLGIALRSALDDRREALEANAPKNRSVDEDTFKTPTLKEEREEAVRLKAEQAAREAAERVHELAQGWTDGPGERDNDGGVAVPPTLTDVSAPSDVTNARRGGRGGKGGSGLGGGRGTNGHGGKSGGNRGGGSNGTGMNRGSSWW
ncbi:hypothetical protein B0A49_09762 [Cryomyces minteri]|uniref:Uncharacterized protein n=1 Tax=Cryomyces minteri TaxID=331657 RepID=A0A4U0X366_9PEZI|nr:hypothetical protein B0A49_09762 [Cryomyces minteri]